MKILFVAPYFPPTSGGAENYVFNIALGFIKTQEVVVITSNTTGKKQHVENYFGMRVYRLPIMFRVSNTPINPLWYFSIKKIIRDEKPDIINSHQPVVFIGDLVALLAGSIPFVLTYHSGTMKKNRLFIDIIISLYEKYILPNTAKKATSIICASGFVRDTILKDFTSKIDVIYPGVDISLYKPDPQVRRAENVVLFIARYKKMFTMKGLYYLIAGVNMLGNVKLHVVGETDDNNDENIEFIGLKQGKDLVVEMQKATLLVLPSLAHMESFGMVLVEAMACQTPVIGTNIGGIPEVITDGEDGFLVPAKSSSDLAQAISKIVTDKELAARMGRAGEAKVKEKFTWDTRVELTKEVFLTCLMAGPATPMIAQVVSYYPPHLGGMENCAAQIAEGLVEKGYPVAVYTSDIGYSPRAAVPAKAHVHYLKSLEFAHTPLIATLFFRLLALPRRSLMHLHVSQAFTPEIVYMVSKLRGIPYIAHIHLDVDPSGPFGFLLETYKQVFLKRVLRSAAKIICLSEPQRQLIAAKYTLPLESIVVIPNGVADRYFVAKKASDMPHLLFVGRLVAQKNLGLLIRAVAQMRTRVIVDIVGEGEERESIEALIQEYGLQNIELHGIKTGQELLELYRSAGIFVLPSLKEGVSLSMLEALAAGLPVVASASPEIRQILGKCGVLIQDPTATNYAEALDALLSDKDRLQRLATLSVQKAHSYSWKNVLNSIENLYKDVYEDAYKEVNI